MYSPKLREELIGPLYRLARAEGRPMTEVASDAVRLYLQLHGVLRDGEERGDTAYPTDGEAGESARAA